jgi:hypothetical protein
VLIEGEVDSKGKGAGSHRPETSNLLGQRRRQYGQLRRSDEDRQKEDELNERECDQHSDLQLTDGLGLSGHALQTGPADESKTERDAKCGESKSNYVHLFVSPELLSVCVV